MPGLSLRRTFLAAVSLAAVSGAVAHAAPTPPVAIEHAAPFVDEANAEKPAVAKEIAKKAGFAAAIAAIVAGLVGLIGPKRVWRALIRAGHSARVVAAETVAASAKLARAAVAAVASPFRFAMLMAGLGLFAIAGIGFYDLEWAGGLLAGIIATAAAFWGGRRLGHALRPVTAPARRRVNP